MEDHTVKGYVYELEKKFTRHVQYNDNEMFLSYERKDGVQWDLDTSFILNLDDLPTSLDTDQIKLYEYFCTILSLIYNSYVKQSSVFDEEIVFIRKIRSVLNNTTIGPGMMENLVSMYRERV